MRRIRSQCWCGFQSRFWLAIPVLCLLLWGESRAESFGQLKGLVLDETGRPLADILLSLVETASPAKTLPLLARSDAQGTFQLDKLPAGTYQLMVRSADYLAPYTPIVEVLPNRTSIVNLVLQQVFSLEGFPGENVSAKALLRSTQDGRLIFRTLPDAAGEQTRAPFFDQAVFQIYTKGGPNSDYFVYPGDSASGTTTNFALVGSEGGYRYIFAGQLNSGQDSLLRLKNFFYYQLGENQTLELFMGYSRMSFDQPRLSLLTDPTSLDSDPGFTRADGTTKILSLGVKDRLLVGKSLSLVWGFEVDQLRGGYNRTFIHPNAEVSFQPWGRTNFRLLLASKRPTYSNSVVLPDGERVNLADSLSFTQIENQLEAAANRYLQLDITHKLDSQTQVQLAFFENRRRGGEVPLLAFFAQDPQLQVLQLPGERLRHDGVRFTLQRSFGENLKGSFSYLAGEADGLVSRLAGDPFEQLELKSLLDRQRYQSLASQVEAVIPRTETRLIALVKAVIQGDPLPTLDSFSDVFETGNKGIHLFVRQSVPLPSALLGFLGLQFLSQYELEALLDLRNLTQDDLGVIHTPQGDFLLVRQPRTVRGGISLKF